MSEILQRVNLCFEYPVYFTECAFSPDNPVFAKSVTRIEPDKKHRLLFIIDENVAAAHPKLTQNISEYLKGRSERLERVASDILTPGGERAKNDPALVTHIQQIIYREKMCRHSFVIAIGGGAVLDMAGYACSTPHRGLRHIRMPTTVMAQNDSGVGIKNAVNAFDRKNFLGTFAPPFAVIDDFTFLTTLSRRDWLAGVAEAIKVALLKDENFFRYIEENTAALVARDKAVMRNTIRRCAKLHLTHIATSGDPFELGQSRPLDFGHWAAHKLEHLSGYRLRHGEAVASGIALDVCYSQGASILGKAECLRILQTLKNLQFTLYHPEMGNDDLLNGLEEFREHLGGTLCITLLKGIAQPIETGEMNHDLIRSALQRLKEYPLGL